MPTDRKVIRRKGKPMVEDSRGAPGVVTIDIRGRLADKPLRARVSRQMGAALRQLRVSPVVARAAFFDDDGPKGGVATRCALTVRLPYRPAVRVEHVAETPRRAFDGGFAVLVRQLARYREREREGHRRPKKYYAAKRLLAAGIEAAEGKE